MKRIVVIYQSAYGYTQTYAEWISEELNCPCFSKKDFHSQGLSNYDVIVFGGGLYAGGINGVDLLSKHADLLTDCQLVLFTCGLADPASPSNREQITRSVEKALPPALLNRCQTFFLRGGIDYGRLSFMHKAMMSMLRRMLLKKGDSQTDEDRQILQTFGQTLDFTDRNTITPLLDYVRNL